MLICSERQQNNVNIEAKKISWKERNIFIWQNLIWLYPLQKSLMKFKHLY